MGKRIFRFRRIKVAKESTRAEKGIIETPKSETERIVISSVLNDMEINGTESEEFTFEGKTYAANRQSGEVRPVGNRRTRGTRQTAEELQTMLGVLHKRNPEEGR